MTRLVASLPLLVVFGCWEPKENSLFSSDGAQSSLAGVDLPGGSGGAGSAAGSASGAVAGQEMLETGGSGAYPVAGSGGSVAQAGGRAETDGTGSTSMGGGDAGNGGSGNPPAPVSCDTIEGAVANAANGHCYRVNLDEIDFAAAREACRAAGAHLVTIGSEAENAFVSQLLTHEHWLGASDNESNTTQGPGTYSWVNDEPWEYDAWQDGQPNAKETGCPTEDEGSACYEHCGFQTDKADWNDRSCWHTIPSVCEWELESDTK